LTYHIYEFSDGLVQVPCIERNSLGGQFSHLNWRKDGRTILRVNNAAVKALTAAQLAMASDGVYSVSLDEAIAAMRLTAADMSVKYKETSLSVSRLGYRRICADSLMMSSTGTCGKLTNTKMDGIMIMIGLTDHSEDSPDCSCLVINFSCMCRIVLLTNGDVANASLEHVSDDEREWSTHNSSNI
jgi:hypothetical protein